MKKLIFALVPVLLAGGYVSLPTSASAECKPGEWYVVTDGGKVPKKVKFKGRASCAGPTYIKDGIGYQSYATYGTRKPTICIGSRCTKDAKKIQTRNGPIWVVKFK